MSPSIFLFGATSILGFNLARLFPAAILSFAAPGNRAPAVRAWPILSLEDSGWLEALFRDNTSEILLYGHAVCDVPKCEAAPAWAREINVRHLERTVAALPPFTRLVYISSDHVFGGDGVYDEDSAPCPVSAYGQTRVEAETLALARPGSLVVRVGLPIGASPNRRTGHLDWLGYRMRRGLPVTIVHDEYRSAVWASDLAQTVIQLARSDKIGICHIVATRAVSRVELANYLLSLSHINANYQSESRYQRAVPHLGRVELASRLDGELFTPLQSVVP